MRRVILSMTTMCIIMLYALYSNAQANEIVNISNTETLKNHAQEDEALSDLKGTWVLDSLYINEINPVMEKEVNYSDVKDIVSFVFDKIQFGTDNICQLLCEQSERQATYKIEYDIVTIKYENTELAYRYQYADKEILSLQGNFSSENVSGKWYPPFRVFMRFKLQK